MHIPRISEHHVRVKAKGLMLIGSPKVDQASVVHLQFLKAQQPTDHARISHYNPFTKVSTHCKEAKKKSKFVIP